MAANDKVMIADADYSEASMDSVVERALDAYAPDLSGKSILVKPNILAQFKPERGATTNPALVKAVVKALKKRNPKKIMVGDNPGATAFGINEKCAKMTGILDAAGDCYVNLMERPKVVDIGSPYLETVNISSEFFECDYFINLPKLKGHCHAYMTGCVKNLYGMCVGAEKARLHVIGKDPRRFAEVLVDVYSTRMPDLHIMDAVVAMEGSGPTNGPLVDVGKVLAGTNGFTLDAVCAKMVGYDIDYIKTLVIGQERGHWSGDVSAIELDGEIPIIEKFKPPSTFQRLSSYSVFSRFISPFNSRLPKIDKKKCKKCGLCAGHCPISACVFTKGEVPTIDKKECIKCYCCQEFCPHDAISLDGMMFKLTNFLAQTRRDI